MEIWLRAAIEAHKFIPEEYWLENYSFVKRNLYTFIKNLYLRRKRAE